MQALWAREEATVAEVQQAMAGERALAMTTVATILTRLEQRGLVAHRREGRQYVYRARVKSEALRGSMVGTLLQTLFQGDVTAFISHLLDGRDLDADELARLQRLVREKDRSRDGR
jgi:BlaI family transcriptional regulator, penicillinase repressor